MKAAKEHKPQQSRVMQGIQKYSILRNTPLQKFHSHPKEKKAPNIILSNEEQNGGHTIARHVCTRAQAILRIQNEGQVPTSFWPDLLTAQSAVQQIINSNWYAIKAWANIQGGGQINYTMANDNGKVMYDDLVEHKSDNAQIFIRKNQPNPNNVLVITCFPTLNANPQVGKPANKIYHLDDYWQSEKRRKEQQKHIKKGIGKK